MTFSILVCALLINVWYSQSCTKCTKNLGGVWGCTPMGDSLIFQQVVRESCISLFFFGKINGLL